MVFLTRIAAFFVVLCLVPQLFGGQYALPVKSQYFAGVSSAYPTAASFYPSASTSSIGSANILYPGTAGSFGSAGSLYPGTTAGFFGSSGSGSFGTSSGTAGYFGSVGSLYPSTAAGSLGSSGSFGTSSVDSIKTASYLPQVGSLGHHVGSLGHHVGSAGYYPGIVSTTATATQCHTYKAYVQSSSVTAVSPYATTSMASNPYMLALEHESKRRRLEELTGSNYGTHGSQMSSQGGYHVLVLEAVPLTSTSYKCTLHSETSTLYKYSFTMSLSAKYDRTGVNLVYAPSFSAISAMNMMTGLEELEGSQFMTSSTDIVSIHLRSMMAAEQVMFSAEGHIVFHTSSTQLIFMKACATSSVSTVYPATSAISSMYPAASGGSLYSSYSTGVGSAANGVLADLYSQLGSYGTTNYFRRRRLEEANSKAPTDPTTPVAVSTKDVKSIIYTVDQSSYKVNGTATSLSGELPYEQPINMECTVPEGDQLSCFLKVANSIRFTATVGDDFSVTPGPIISTLMMPLGAAQDVERHLVALLDRMNRMEVHEGGNFTLFAANGAALTFVPTGVIGAPTTSNSIADIAERRRRLHEDADAGAEWVIYGAKFDDYSQDGISGLHHFVADKALVQELDVFPLRLAVNTITPAAHAVKLQVVNDYRMTVSKPASSHAWVSSTPVPLTSMVGPAPAMLMESMLLNTIGSLSGFAIDDSKVEIEGAGAKVVFRKLNENPEDLTVTLSAMEVPGQENLLEGAHSTSLGKVTMRLINTGKDAYKTVIKGQNTYCFDVAVVQNRPVCTPVVVTQQLTPTINIVEQRVLDIFQSATSLTTTNGALNVVSPAGRLSFI